VGGGVEMHKLLKRLWDEESGMGTVEIVIIVAILVGVALLFRSQITNFVQSATDKVFDTDIIDESINVGGPTTSNTP
jgi:Flp pilus assembly pilin Flp